MGPHTYAPPVRGSSTLLGILPGKGVIRRFLKE